MLKRELLRTRPMWIHGVLAAHTTGDQRPGVRTFKPMPPDYLNIEGKILDKGEPVARSTQA